MQIVFFSGAMCGRHRLTVPLYPDTDLRHRVGILSNPLTLRSTCDHFTPSEPESWNRNRKPMPWPVPGKQASKNDTIDNGSREFGLAEETREEDGRGYGVGPF